MHSLSAFLTARFIRYCLVAVHVLDCLPGRFVMQRALCHVTRKQRRGRACNKDTAQQPCLLAANQPLRVAKKLPLFLVCLLTKTAVFALPIESTSMNLTLSLVHGRVLGMQRLPCKEINGPI